MRRQLSATLAIAALAIGVAVSIPASSLIPGTNGNAYPMEISAAHLRGDYIVVDFATGCRGLIRAEETQQFGNPVVSTDGKQILFRVIEENACELVLFESEHQRIRKFSSCPVIESDITT